MTDQNNAAQPGLTDDEILQVFADVVGNREDDARFIDVDRDQAIRIARTLLSKLRAEGVQAGDDYAPHHDQPHQTGVGEWCAPGPAADQRPAWLLRFADTDRGDCVYYDEQEARRAFAQAEGRGWNCYLFEFARRAALASAPVVGEAHPVAWHCNEVGVTDIAHVAQGWREELGFTVRPLVFGDAAPQASEAVRNEALYLLREARGLLPAFATAEAIGAWSEKVNRFAAGDVIDIPPQADKDGGDCAKGAGDQPDIETLRRVGAAHDAVQVCPECDIAGCKHIRAALSPTQPTGGRDEA